MRTSKRNALISFIPLYGLSSYFYLGKKLGFQAWFTCFFIGLLPLVIILIPDSSVQQNPDFIIVTILLILIIFSYVIQYIVMIKFTDKKNMVKKI